MKIAVHSDLHLEGNRLHEDFLKDNDFDILVLAGDIVTHTSTLRLQLIREATDKKIIYIPGNHEYYKGSYEATNSNLKIACDTLGIDFTPRGVIKVGEFNFICCTGWSDLQAFSFDFGLKKQAVKGISDFYQIQGHNVETMIELSLLDKLFLINSLEALKGQSNIIVTHFSPTENHGNERFIPSEISAYFSNSWEDIIYDYSPIAWIYGHTHGNVELDIYHTKVFTNQHGYGKENPNYNPNYIVTV